MQILLSLLNIIDLACKPKKKIAAVITNKKIFKLLLKTSS